MLNLTPMKTNQLWQFWIDVGGTFTDCLSLDPAGKMHRHKVLSSGVIPGRFRTQRAGHVFVDEARERDADNVWQGYQCRFRNATGAVVFQATIAESQFGVGRLVLTEPIPTTAVAASYEIFSDEEAPLVAIRYILGLGRMDSLPPVRIRLGTTRGTNALLTRSGARVGLIVTCGFADLPAIGYQNRPELFQLAIRKPMPLHEYVIEADARMDANGRELVSLDPEHMRSDLESMRLQGIDSLAVCLLHAVVNPRHELMVGRLAREMGFSSVSLSHEVAPVRKIVPRLDTTIVDAYLNPTLQDYFARLTDSVAVEADSALRVMTSAGGLVSARQFSGKDSLLSGPAGGAIAYARVAAAAGFSRAIGFDMGGTSSDVSRYDGRFEREYETQKAGVRIVAPMLAIETVAAGGGSICRFDGVKLVVGPESAGAAPGPACYGHGGPCTITDANLLLGRIPEEQFTLPLHVDAARESVEQLCREVERTLGRVYSPVELCDGLVRIANTHMAQAIRSVSLAKGFHPKEYVLVAFGGAAPQHACGLARELQMSRILVPTDAGILSALGMGLAPISRNVSRSVRIPLDSVDFRDLERHWDDLAELATQQLQGEGIARDQVTTEYSLSMRYQRMDAELLLMRPADKDLRREFESVHLQRYGYCHRDRSLEVTALHVEGVGRTELELPPSDRMQEIEAPKPIGKRAVSFDGHECQVFVYDRKCLQPGHSLWGPVLIAESYGVVVVEPGWRAEVLGHGHLLLSDIDHGRLDHSMTKIGDPVMLEVFHRNFASIAEQMGVTLRNTSMSVNVKERLDFSCALFDANANLVVNAPHVPVHLGGMGETVRNVVASFPDLVPGDVIITNDPYRGGSHLPDVTVITPVHDESGALVFFAASRAHHAEIGGMLPGSMPPFSKCLADEGVVISPLKIIDAGRLRWDELESLLRSGRYPSRSVQENLTDISAQIAANQQGVVDLRRLMDRYGRQTVESYMRDIQRAAAEKMRMALQRIPPGAHTFADTMDDGTPIQVCLHRIDGRLKIDFSGTGAVSPGNLNANLAICTAAVMYVLRCFLDEDIPLNAGILEPVELFVPPGLLNPPVGASPEQSPAVAGGNVETSQRIVDVLLGSLQLAAASQGTMNNLLFGDSGFGYYETICGGAGATPNCDGADAVQTHMTNTRITDPEVLESRYPVRLRQFSIRRGSGGKGKYRGGDGVVRELEFLREVDVSLLSQRRLTSPYGMQGGEDGLSGRNERIDVNGQREELPGSAAYRAQPGEVLRIETPGGGAWGAIS